MKKLNYIDLFAGAGGLSEGFIRAGFNPIAHVEMNKDACDTLRTRAAYHWLIENGKKKIVPIGEGLLNYELLMGLIKKHKPHLEILLEAVDPANVERIHQYLADIYERV